MTKMTKKALLSTLLPPAALAAYGLALRPWFLRWGATDDEVAGPWPGDEITPDAATQATRAITIDAPASAIWPWIVQIGQDRGGFYSYAWLENLFGARMRNADRLLPDLPARQVGDTVWLATPEHYGGRGCQRIAFLIPERAMVLVSPADYDEVRRSGVAPHGAWTFLLHPVDERTTRLILRSRGAADPGLAGRLWTALGFDPAHFIMERKMMLGIRERVVGEPRAARKLGAAA